MICLHKKQAVALAILGFLGGGSAMAEDELADVLELDSAELDAIGLASTESTSTVDGNDEAESSVSVIDVEALSREVLPASTDLFASHSWYKAPPPPPVRMRRIVQQAATPTAPPLPFKFLGRYDVEGSETVFIVSKDDSVYDVHLGDVIENTYSVDKVSGGRLMFTYLPMQQAQALDLGEVR